MSESSDEEVRLDLGVPHPAAVDARKWIDGHKLSELSMKYHIMKASDSLLNQVCADTLARLLRGQNVGDRFLLGLAWRLRCMEWNDHEKT